MNYTDNDYKILKQSLKYMTKIKVYIDELIMKLELECVICDEDKSTILDDINYMVDKQDYFNVTNYKENQYIDVSYKNLLFSIYNTNDNDVFLGEGFEVWNDEEGYLIGVFSIAQIKDILKLRGNK